MSFPEDKKVNTSQDGVGQQPVQGNGSPQQMQQSQMPQQPQVPQQPQMQQAQMPQQGQQPQMQQQMPPQPQMAQQPGMTVASDQVMNTAMNARNKRRGLLITALIIVAVLIVGAVGGYFYYKRTPTYSLKVLGEAIEERDTRTVEEYVDLNQVFVDFMTGAVRSESKELYVNPSEAVKTKLVASMQDEINQEAKDTAQLFINAIKNSKGSKDKQKSDGKNKKQEAKNVLESNDFFDRVKYEKVQSIETNGKTAVATILFKLEEYNIEVPLIFNMEQNSDGSWMITSLENGEDVWSSISAAMQKQLDLVNAPLKKEIDRYVTLGDLKGKVMRARGMNQPYVYFYIPVTTHEKAVQDINGVITISGVGPDNRIIRLNGGWHSNVNRVGNNGAWSSTYYLKAYDDDDYLLSQTNLDTVQMSFEPRSITFFDGTSITLKDDVNE